MKTIVITGGAGFIGSNLCDRLSNENNRVIAIDNLYTGREQNISHLYSNNNFTFIKADIVDDDIAGLLQPFGHIDEIYNLACPASPPAYQNQPIKTLKTSVIGIMKMLDIATEYNAKILQSSTSEVYGDPEVHPQGESYRGNVNPIGIRACYDEGKRCTETLCFDYNRQYGTKVKVIRIFNTYGPNMDPKDGRVVSNFILQALQNQDITIYGDGTQTRSFCYVDDLVEGMIRMMNSRDDFLGPINLGNPGEFTMIELAKEVLSLIDSQSKIVYKELPADDPTRRKPNIDLAKKELGWNPQVMLNEGLKRTIEYYRQYVV